MSAKTQRLFSARWATKLRERRAAMTQTEKLKIRLPEISDAEAESYLDTAKAAIMARRYPFEDFPDELEGRYLDLQLRIAADLYAKAGAEGETSHSENGVSRAYSNAWVSEELLSEVTPKGRVL
jgi:hypothetical protein